ncbi:MAG: leucine-rich repeat domain-containing protein [Oscillospiraceae bacterium]|nr:leucine-rich repeat domain-containing protein [Oscillospiraceae bacterium]
MRKSLKKALCLVIAFSITAQAETGLFSGHSSQSDNSVVSAALISQGYNGIKLISTGIYGTKLSVEGSTGNYWLYYRLLSTTDKTASIIGCVATGEVSEIVIPETVYGDYKVTEIYQDAFNGQTDIKKVSGMKWVTKIGERAFKDCTSLESIKQDNYLERAFGQKISEIGSQAFYNCSSLNSSFVSNLNYIKKIGSEAFYNTGTLGSVANITCIEQLGEQAFRYSRVTSAMIGLSAGKVPKRCFSDCSDLAQVEFTYYNSKTLTAIDDYAFASCAVKEIKIPDSVTTIGDRAFRDCRQLECAVIPDSVTTIKSGAFKYCSHLSKTTYSSQFDWYPSVFNQEISIGKEAFYDTAMTSVIFKSKVNVGERAFADCPTMRGAVIENPNSYIASKGLGFTDTLQKIDGFTLSGSSKAQSYAAHYGFNYSDQTQPIDFSPFVWGTANKNEIHGVKPNGSDTYNYYLNSAHAALLDSVYNKELSSKRAADITSRPCIGVCTGLAALSVMQYMKSYNVFDNVPAIIKNGSPVTELRDVNGNNIDNSLRSLITYYWAAANTLNADKIYGISAYGNNVNNSIKKLYDYCRLINTGIFPPFVYNNSVNLENSSHTMVAYGAQYKSEAYTAENAKYWSHTVNGVTAQFDARILLYDDGFNNISDYNCLYINTQTGEFCREQRYYNVGGSSNISISVIPYDELLTLPSPEPEH